MKITTKAFLIVAISLFTLQSFAQNVVVKAGLNMANMLIKDDDINFSEDFSMNPGFHIGAAIDIPVADMFSIEPGLFFETKGARYKESFLGITGKEITNLFYIDVPVRAKVFYEINDEIKVFGAMGPYFGLGLFGNIKTVFELLGDKEKEKEAIKWGNDEDDDDLKRFDFGLTFGGGVEYNKLQAGISFDLGMANISPYTEDGTKVKNRLLRFSVGYNIGQD